MKFPFKIKIYGINRGESGKDLSLFRFVFAWWRKGAWSHLQIEPEIATNPEGKIALWGKDDEDGTRSTFLLGVIRLTSDKPEYQGVYSGQIVIGPLMVKVGGVLE